MIPELGQLCLCLALAAAVLQAAVPLLHRYTSPYPVMGLTRPLAMVNFMLVAGAFAALVNAYAMSDFSVVNVVLNSHSAKPLIYKITGSWGNHEGSMLLWALVLAGYGALIACMHTRDNELTHLTLTMLGMINTGFLAFILFTSNPFLRAWPIPPDGEDLNPLLQDIGLALHPPTLYVGYVGFGVVFAFAIAGLWLRRIDPHWAKAVQPWILLPWCALTLGIGAGSWWAYRELGWGGWWFWDPVENVSLLPWLAGTALLHSNLVLERRGQLARWVALLAILTFSLSLIGTFIVRSGLITSVHAFASDPARGLFILLYIVIVTGGALLVFGIRDVPQSAPVNLLSRGGMILLNNLLLLAAAGIVLTAILYPLVLQLAGGPAISIGPPYFNRTFLPLVAPLPILAAIAPLIAWDRTSAKYLKKQWHRMWPALAVAVMVCLAIAQPPLVLQLAGVALGCWLLLGVVRYFKRVRRASVRLSSSAGLRYLATTLGHTAMAVLVLAITATGLFRQTYEAPLTAKHPITLGAYTLKLESASRAEEHNYVVRRATFRVVKDGQLLTRLTPELRYYPVRQTQTTEAAIFSTPLRDIYLVIGDATYGAEGEEAKLGVRMYVSPGQQWIWIAFLLAGLSGALALAGHLRSHWEDR